MVPSLVECHRRTEMRTYNASKTENDSFWKFFLKGKKGSLFPLLWYMRPLSVAIYLTCQAAVPPLLFPASPAEMEWESRSWRLSVNTCASRQWEGLCRCPSLASKFMWMFSPHNEASQVGRGLRWGVSIKHTSDCEVYKERVQHTSVLYIGETIIFLVQWSKTKYSVGFFGFLFCFLI